MGDRPEIRGARVRVTPSDAVLRHRWLGTCGAVALSAASGWAGALPVYHPTSHWYESQPLVTLAAAAFGYAGLIVLVVSWWRLGRLTASGAPGGRSGAPAGGREMVVTLCWWAAPLTVAAPMFSRDVYSYAAQGAMAARGMDVYTAGPSLLGGPLTAGVDWLWRDTPAPYGPVFVWLADHVVRMTGENVVAAVVGMRVVALLGLALVVWAVRRLAVALAVCEARAVWLAVLNPLVLVHLVGGAHNDAVMLGLMLCGLLLARRGQLVGAAAVITLAMLVKAPAGLALLFLVPRRAEEGAGAVRRPGESGGPVRRPGESGGPVRRAAVVAVTAVATAGAATAVLGYGYGWLSALGTPTAAAGLLSLTSDAGALLAGIGDHLGLADPDRVVTAARLSGVAAALAALPLWWWRVPRLGPERALGLALLTVVVLAPAVQPWYFLWGLLPLAVTDPGGRAGTRLAAASTGLLFTALLRGQNSDAAYVLSCYAGAAVALLVLSRFDPVARSPWQIDMTHRQTGWALPFANPVSRI